MDKLDKTFFRAESNVCKEISLTNGSIVFGWTLLCLFVMSKNTIIEYAIVTGALYYITLVIVCLSIFEDIRDALSFPRKDIGMPIFIGHKLDLVFTYPMLVMAVIGILSSVLTGLGLISEIRPQADMTGSALWAMPARLILMPLTAYAEEMQNFLLISLLFKYVRLPGKLRLGASILLAAFVFGLMHAFGWGIQAAIPIGIAYIPVFAVTLYTGNIWVSFLAHLYNDLISFSKYYYGSSHLIVIAAVAVVPVIWAIKSIFKRKP